LLSEVEFGAFLVYSPRGQSEMSQRSRQIRDHIKHDKPGFLRTAADRLKVELSAVGLEAFLGPQVTLVPAPRSAPLVGKDALWPGHRICEELLKCGLGKDILPCLSRAKRVAKSAFAAPGERVGAQEHLESMEVEGILLSPAVVTVVDDFLTKGATLLAAASLVKDAFPLATVRVFALVRTLGLIPDVERTLDPCRGRIWLEGSVIRREP
jgi:hypothetical protein